MILEDDDQIWGESLQASRRAKDREDVESECKLLCGCRLTGFGSALRMTAATP